MISVRYKNLILYTPTAKVYSPPAPAPAAGNRFSESKSTASEFTPSGTNLFSTRPAGRASAAQRWLVFTVAMFLVSGPVFIEAPLVRYLPWLSLALSPLLFWGGRRLLATPPHGLTGDLLLGFAWTWVSGSIYWGWFRWEPLVHLPIEAIGLPFALWCIARNWGKVGNFFYLGSLLGTALTDIYFYLTDLMPYWRSVMRVETQDLAAQILRHAWVQINNPWGLTWASLLAALLMGISLMTILGTRQVHWWAFGGAVLGTIFVDGLFAIAALIS